MRQIPKSATLLALVTSAMVVAGCSGNAGQDASIDRDFIDMMVPHHESAIAMAEIAQDRAEHPELRQMADEIIGAQSAEIAQLKKWRQEWFGSSNTPSMAEMPMLPGMSPAGHSMSGGTMDMTAEVDGLRDADPFDRLFIDAMIQHHEQAVEAAEIVLARTDRQEIRGLAQNIVAAQTSEIEQLRKWRAAWY
ncbi:MAG: DUF305 domain-containing protein [Chloroflexota bacterium]|nr:DUF305 domain-containing protein [Chloroflexota bacterium]